MINLTHDEFRGGANVRPTNADRCLGDRLHRITFWHINDAIEHHTDRDDDETDPIFDDDDRFAVDGPIATAIILAFDVIGAGHHRPGLRRRITVVMCNQEDTRRTAHQFDSCHPITDNDNWDALTGIIADVRAGMGIAELRSVSIG